MRILWYSRRDVSNPEADGAETFTYEVCKRLVGRHGIKSVTLYTSGFEGCKRKETIDGVRIVRSESRSVHSGAREFYNANKDDFDLVVDEIDTRPFGTPSFVGGKPVVALIHQLAREYWFHENRFPTNILGYYFLEKYWLRKYRNLTTITVSNSTRQGLQDFGFEDVRVVAPGLSFSPLQMLPETEIRPTVLFAGKLIKAKKPDDAVRAFRIIKDRIRDAKLWVVGSGYMEEEIRAMVQKMFPNEIADITIFGKLSTDQRLQLMSRAHVLLAPGVREGWSTAIAEASAMGTPAVAYDVPGLRDSVIEGVTGKLVTRDDHLGMALETIDLLQDHIKRKTLAKNGMQQAKQFRWDTTAANFAEILVQTQSGYRQASQEQRAV
jgi:glycosyltransferase involved in cell wall biosynthesis